MYFVNGLQPWAAAENRGQAIRAVHIRVSASKAAAFGVCSFAWPAVCACVCVRVCAHAPRHMPTGHKYLALYLAGPEDREPQSPPIYQDSTGVLIWVLMPSRSECLQHCEQADYILCKGKPLECFHFVSFMIGSAGAEAVHTEYQNCEEKKEVKACVATSGAGVGGVEKYWLEIDFPIFKSSINILRDSFILCFPIFISPDISYQE